MAEATLSAISDQGRPVDWWFVYKIAGKSIVSDGSKAKGTASDGSDPGADTDAVMKATAGVTRAARAGPSRRAPSAGGGDDEGDPGRGEEQDEGEGDEFDQGAVGPGEAEDCGPQALSDDGPGRDSVPGMDPAERAEEEPDVVVDRHARRPGRLEPLCGPAPGALAAQVQPFSQSH